MRAVAQVHTFGHVYTIHSFGVERSYLAVIFRSKYSMVC